MIKVLLVDDEKNFTEMLKLNLEATGKYEVEVVNNPLNAIPHIIQSKPDIVFLDIIMPDLEGPDIAIQIKENTQIKSIPIIFLTATITADEAVSQGGQIGGNNFVAKPSSIDKLSAIIDSHVK